MARTLHFTLPQDRLHPAMGSLLRRPECPHNGYQLRVADALWAQKGNTFLGDFLQLMKNDYGAGFNQVISRTRPKRVRLTINKWVEEKTDDKSRICFNPVCSLLRQIGADKRHLFQRNLADAIRQGANKG